MNCFICGNKCSCVYSSSTYYICKLCNFRITNYVGEIYFGSHEKLYNQYVYYYKKDKSWYIYYKNFYIKFIDSYDYNLINCDILYGKIKNYLLLK